MSLELVSTLASVGTFAVIGATAIAAVVQLRHMRASNQLQGLLTVLARVEDPKWNTWFTEAQRSVPALLSDPEYRKQIEDGTYDRNIAWLFIGNSYEWVGSLIRHRLIPEDTFLDVYAARVVRTWELLEDITAISRRKRGSQVWENFEYLYVISKALETRDASVKFPHHLSRVALPDRWLDEDRRWRAEQPDLLLR